MHERETRGRQIEFVLPGREVIAVAELLESVAPLTCAAVWDLLPAEGQLYHGRSSGREIGLMVHNPSRDIPPENRTIHCQSGDVFLYYSPTGTRGNVEPRTTIIVFYGRDTVPMGAEGPMAGNHFAELRSGKEAFASACEAIWREGWETLVVRRRGRAAVQP
jgi:hypothetical protein